MTTGTVAECTALSILLPASVHDLHVIRGNFHIIRVRLVLRDRLTRKEQARTHDQRHRHKHMRQ
jgi:hypothetical protein